MEREGYALVGTDCDRREGRGARCEVSGSDRKGGGSAQRVDPLFKPSPGFMAKFRLRSSIWMVFSVRTTRRKEEGTVRSAPSHRPNAIWGKPHSRAEY